MAQSDRSCPSPAMAIGSNLALNRRLLHDETGIKTIGQITEIGVVSQ